MVLLTWNKKRNELTKNDIKIVQHLYNCNKEKTVKSISTELGFSNRQINTCLSNLLDAEIVENCNDLWRLKSLEDIFFIEEIVSIEAKLKDWRNALRQTENNDYFSSEVYALFPDNVVNENLLKNYSNTNIGVVTYRENYKVVKPANKKDLPVTINGWLFNELIGRMLWQKN